LKKGTTLKSQIHGFIIEQESGLIDRPGFRDAIACDRFDLDAGGLTRLDGCDRNSWLNAINC
jgi:hypothetical protein